MNETVKTAVIENEKRLLAAFPEYGLKIKPYISKLMSIIHDETFYSFICASFSKKEEQEKNYNRKGYLSSRQIIENLKSELDFCDSVFFESLVEGNLYSKWDICSLAKNYNYQIGMYYCKNEDAVIIKTTTNDNKRPYPDYWINDFDLYYYLQNESEKNRESKEFSNKPNRVIYSSLINKENTPIYVFCNEKIRDPFKYAGIFHVKKITDDNLAFILSKDDRTEQ